MFHPLRLSRLACALALGTALPCAFAAGAGAAPTTTMRDPGPFIAKWDQSGKGLLSLGIIDNAAIVKFESLDSNHMGHLTLAQLSSLLTPKEFALANPDGDSTIGVDEWLDLVKHRFARANTDRDGTLDAQELRTPAGQRLLALVD